MKKRNVIRAMAIVGLVLMVMMGAAVPAGLADHGGPEHLVCIHVYYEYPPGSQPQDVVNECRVGTTWAPAVDNFECQLYEQPILINICRWIAISIP